ncbi:MAG: polyphosphate polymerase domain-containing protein [Bacteroidales bacterium]|nr:polyphosphate polymerase domain-containing protein [Bacteroidales bacterium]
MESQKIAAATRPDDLAEVLHQFHTITLEEIKAVKLMSRVDQKYIIPRQRLPELLDALSGCYHLQTIADDPIADYHTLYFDTEDLEMYTVHHNKKLQRQKLRVRCYRSTQTTFFEVKNKNNRGRTNKTRIVVPPTEFYDCMANEAVRDFLAHSSSYTPERLLPQLENQFQRLTLANYGMTERVTIDLDIRYHNHQTLRDGDLCQVVVIEVKYDSGSLHSDIKDQLNDMRLLPRRMSKYCIGTVLTNPAAKYNRFKDKLRYIEKMGRR